MKTIAFVVPYYGEFPNYFPAWLNSCRQNPSVDFLIFTDNSPDCYSVPSNVQFIHMSFNELRSLIQRQFEFKICLGRPYKLCDYKPVYGIALHHWLAEYDFWGHCDIDLLWGNIRQFFTDDLLDKYDRICNQGHCSIYRNNQRVNSLYRSLDSKGCLDWREVFTSDKSFAFDEYGTIHEDGSGGGLSRIMEINGEQIYSTWIFANITPKQQSRFQLSLDDHERECDPDQIKAFEHRYYSTESEAEMQFFERNKEGLFLWYCKNGLVQKKEFLYVHFSRRAIKCPKGLIHHDNYLFLPPAKIIVLDSPLAESDKLKRMQKNHVAIRWYSFVRKNRIIQIVSRLIKKINRFLSNI